MRAILLMLWFSCACFSTVCTASPPELPTTTIAGASRVGLVSLAKLYGFKLHAVQDRVIRMTGKGQSIEFTTDGREVRLNGMLVWLHEPLSPYRGKWYLRTEDVRAVLDPLIRPSLYLQDAGYRVIVLDPGHGGPDTGTQGARRVEEKRVVLDIARRVRRILEKSGYLVYLTRDGDRFIELDERTRKAVAWGGDLFVSIHLNSAASDVPNGTETYALTASGMISTAGGVAGRAEKGNQHDAGNAALTYFVHRALVDRIQEGDRGVKRSRFMVLKTAGCPATLVECAFLSNAHEEERLMDESFRDEVAEGIAKGILDYLSAVKRARIMLP